jgi:mono/diheme cytochrome c family protein
MERVRTSRRAVGVAAAAATAVFLAACGSQSVNSSDNLVAGKQMFVERCGACHTLARAGTKGSVGPNLDAAFARSISEGFQRSVVRGVVADQIQWPSRTGKMPADLVKGQSVNDVAAYVAVSAAKRGEDAGLLASAVKAAGGGGPIAEKDGTLQINADPGGQLSYVSKKATGTPGPVTIKMENPAPVQHDIALQQGTAASGKVLGKGEIVTKGGTSEFQVSDLAAGTYTYFCTVPGHRQAGMFGTLTVR